MVDNKRVMVDTKRPAVDSFSLNGVSKRVVADSKRLNVDSFRDNLSLLSENAAFKISFTVSYP